MIGRVKVKEVVRARYPERPLNWDERIPGIDVIVTEQGDTIELLSDGQQSPPKKGWVILLREVDSEGRFTWTLYGLPKGSEVSDPLPTR
jgi:hypothetical protein